MTEPGRGGEVARRDREVALVTGASSGLGVELARGLARRRQDLVLVARRAERLQEVADELGAAHGVTCHVVPTDLSSREERHRLAQEVERRGLEVAILVNNAGLGQWGPYLELEAEREYSQLQVNVVALTELTRLFLPGMVARRRGRILNVASTAAFFPGPLMTVYYATKAYVLAYSVALTEELRGTGVSATCLCSGPIETEFSERADQDRSRLFDNSSILDTRVMAEAGIEAMFRGEAVRTPGVMNKLSVFGARLLPRRFLAKAVKFIQRPKEISGPTG